VLTFLSLSAINMHYVRADDWTCGIITVTIDNTCEFLIETIGTYQPIAMRAVLEKQTCRGQNR
jgi:hypothetical protein